MAKPAVMKAQKKSKKAKFVGNNIKKANKLANRRNIKNKKNQIKNKEAANNGTKVDEIKKVEPQDDSEHDQESGLESDQDDVEAQDNEMIDQDEDNGASDQSPKKEGETKAKREKRKFDFERNSRTVFVGNLPNNLDHKEVAKLFKSCGPVESARIRSVVAEKEKLAPKVAMITKRIHPKVDSVNAYVVFATNENDECVKKALAMNGKVIDGHHLRVDRATRPKAKKETLTSRKKSVFVGNMRFDLRDDELINHFSKAGSVNYVRIVRDRTTGLGKGFGFVVFDERASVKKALELNDTQFKGRSIRVKKVEEEEGVKKNDVNKTKKDNSTDGGKKGIQHNDRSKGIHNNDRKKNFSGINKRNPNNKDANKKNFSKKKSFQKG